MIFFAWVMVPLMQRFAGVEAEEWVPASCAPVVLAVGAAPLLARSLVLALIRRKEREQDRPAE
jgi:hypothetical protein